MSGWVFETLVATAVLIAVVLVIRRPVARTFGARAAFALWLAPLLRLLMPPLPVSAPTPDIFIETRDAAVQAVAPVQSALPSLGTALLLVWIAGVIAFLGLHLVSYFGFVSTAVVKGHALPDEGGIEVIETEAVTGPAAAGLLVRRIFVPRGFSDTFATDERRLALKHEMLHHKRGDLWASGAALVVLSLHWFNPLAYAAHRAFRRDLEAACDADLLAGAGGDERQLYARTILRCAARSIPQPVCALTDTQELKGRLEMMKHDYSFVRRAIGGFLATALTVGGLLIALPAVAQQAPANESTQETTEVRKIVMHGEGRARDAKVLTKEMREKIAKCEGEKVEANADIRNAGKKQTSRIMICAKPGESKAELANSIEKALGRIEGEDAMTPEAKAQIVAQLRAKIAELRAGK
jgi:beta-lactamase regulating signal transducer with metallopeptidase domain